MLSNKLKSYVMSPNSNKGKSLRLSHVFLFSFFLFGVFSYGLYYISNSLYEIYTYSSYDIFKLYNIVIDGFIEHIFLYLLQHSVLFYSLIFCITVLIFSDGFFKESFRSLNVKDSFALILLSILMVIHGASTIMNIEVDAGLFVNSPYEYLSNALYALTTILISILCFFQYIGFNKKDCLYFLNKNLKTCTSLLLFFSLVPSFLFNYKIVIFISGAVFLTINIVSLCFSFFKDYNFNKEAIKTIVSFRFKNGLLPKNNDLIKHIVSNKQSPYFLSLKYLKKNKYIYEAIKKHNNIDDNDILIYAFTTGNPETDDYKNENSKFRFTIISLDGNVLYASTEGFLKI